MKAPYPVFFLSFDEENADDNWLALRKKFPFAQRLHGIKGILNAHKACAERCDAPMFFVVDGDNEILDFDFTHAPLDTEAIHVWRCQNAVNDLVYGYGAIKLYPKHSLQSSNMIIDVATSAPSRYQIMPELASITRFNTSEFSSWRAAFRECAKLSSRCIANQNSAETLARLETWCSRGADRPFGQWCLAGAQAGRNFGSDALGDPERLSPINDFSWLRSQFEKWKDENAI
jgi:hypothetical protein